MDYKASTAEQELDIINLYRLEKEVQNVLEPGAFGYIHGGAGDEWTLRRNETAFERLCILPRVLADLEHPVCATSILGIDLPFPMMMSPVAAHGLCHVEAEKGTVRGVAEAGTIMGISTYANTKVEDIAAAAPGAHIWFQLYMSKDDGFNRQLLDRAKACGASAIILTADATVGGNREADAINKFTYPLGMPNLERPGDESAKTEGQGKGVNQLYSQSKQKLSPKDVENIASYTGLPVIVKGVQSREDALFALGAGAAAIQVSNHGGRQLDGGPGSFDTLQAIADAVSGRMPIIFDSGIRRGQHVFKALAQGADIVALGRPVLYGLTLGGAKGVYSVFRHLEHELRTVMQLAGTPTIEAVKQTRLISVP